MKHTSVTSSLALSFVLPSRALFCDIYASFRYLKIIHFCALSHPREYSSRLCFAALGLLLVHGGAVAVRVRGRDGLLPHPGGLHRKGRNSVKARSNLHETGGKKALFDPTHGIISSSRDFTY